MADVELIIKIPKEMYQKIKETNMFISGRRSGRSFDYILFNAVNNGTPLPTGHGRLIDESQIHKSGWDYINHHAKTDAPTIIEAEGVRRNDITSM